MLKLLYEDSGVFRICSDTTALCVEVLLIESVSWMMETTEEEEENVGGGEG